MEEPINVTDAAFERAVLQADRPVVAVFWSRQDARAERLREVLEATASHYAGQVRVARLEADDAPQTRARYELDTLPQFLFFRDGRMVARVRGSPTEEMLRPWVEYLLGQGPQPEARPGSQASSLHGSQAVHPVIVTDADFDTVVLGASGAVMVDFWATWCYPCQMLTPVVEQLTAEFAGRALVAKLDVDANPAMAQRYDVRSVPTLIFFKGGQEVDRVRGAQPDTVLRERLERLV
jgi:thioredoxin 1